MTLSVTDLKGRRFNGPDFLQLEEQLWPVEDGKAGLKEVNNSPCIVRWKARRLQPHDRWVSVFVTRSVFASSRPSNNRNNHCQSQKKVLGSQWEQNFQSCQAPLYVLQDDESKGGDTAHGQTSKLSSQAIHAAFYVHTV